MKRGRTVAGLLLIVGLWFAFLGQFYFAYRREYVWDGVFFWCVAIFSFALLLRQTVRLERGRPSGWQVWPWIRQHPLRTVSALGGAYVALWAGWQARYQPATADFSILLWLWLVGVAGFLLAFGPPLPVSFSAREVWLRLVGWVRSRRIELAGLAVLLAVALAVRAVDLEHIPANLGGDEGTQGVAALALLGPPLGNPFSTGWFSVPTMSFLAWGLGMRLFGASVAGLRALSALIGTLTVLTTFLLARELWGRRVAWLAAGALTCAHYHVHFSRLGSNQIADGLLVTLALWLLVRGLRFWQAGKPAPPPRRFWQAGKPAPPRHFWQAGKPVPPRHFWQAGKPAPPPRRFWQAGKPAPPPRRFWQAGKPAPPRRAFTFALAGVTMGLGWYSYFGARLIGIIAALYLAWRAGVEQRFLARNGRLLLIMLAAVLVVVGPLLLHYAAYPEELLSRSRQVSIFASGWLAREQQITGKSAASLLVQQFWKAVSAFHYTLDPTFWYLPAISLLDTISGVLMVLGLVWATARWRWPANGLLLVWFWLALIAGWMMTENPPSSQRMLIITPALALTVGLGLNWLMELVRHVFGGGGAGFRACRERRLWDSVAGLTLVAVAVVNLHYYFVTYTPTRVYGNPTAEVATELGRYLAQEDDGYVVYFYAPPFMYWGFGTLQFLARGVEGVDVYPPGEGELPNPDLNRGARFVFLPERLAELEAVRARAPGGEETPVYSSADGRLLYVIYEVGGQ